MARIVRAIFVLVVTRPMNTQANPDTRSVPGEVPQLFCGILLAPVLRLVPREGTRSAQATPEAISEKIWPLFFMTPA